MVSRSTGKPSHPLQQFREENQSLRLVEQLGGGHRLFEFRQLAYRIKVGVGVHNFQTKSTTERRRQKMKCFESVLLVLPGGQRINAGHLVKGRRAGIEQECRLGIGDRSVALLDPGQKYAPATTGQHRIGIEFNHLLRDL